MTHSGRTLVAVAVMTVASISSGAAEWVSLRDDDIGVQVDVPEHIFPRASEQRSRREISFQAPDNSARLRIFVFMLVAGETPSSHLRRIADAREAQFTYVRTTGRFFVASGLKGHQIFYRRCNWPSWGGGSVACVDLLYPRAEKRDWDQSVAQISNSLQNAQTHRRSPSQDLAPHRRSK